MGTRNLFLIPFLCVGMRTNVARAAAPHRGFGCEPCVDREKFGVTMIVHGASKTGGFWAPVLAAAEQAGRDMGITMQIRTLSKGGTSDEQNAEMTGMIRDISNLPVWEQPQALVVTLPSPEVNEAIAELMEKTEIPVFGLNSGYKAANNELGLLSFVAMDERLGGVEAAMETQLDKHHHEAHVAAEAVQTVADGYTFLAIEEECAGFRLSHAGNNDWNNRTENVDGSIVMRRGWIPVRLGESI